VKINLSDYSYGRKYIKNGRSCTLDLTRKKLIYLTPEEEIRQKFIAFLIEKLLVPVNMIQTEVPMSHLVKGEKGRADIIVYYNDKMANNLKPLLVVECKAPDVQLIDDVFLQAYNYADNIGANYIMVTNGEELVIEKWKEQDDTYEVVSNLPSYHDMLLEENIVIETVVPDDWQRRPFSNLKDENVLRTFAENIGVDTPTEYSSFCMNLIELLWDYAKPFPLVERYGFKVIKDIGIRYTSFGNAAGFDWTGEYRSIIVEISNGNHIIISFNILYGYIIVAIDDEAKSHNSLQLKIKTHVTIKDSVIYYIQHNGRMTVGKLGQIKSKAVLEYITNEEPSFIVNNRVQLGHVENSKLFTWEDPGVLDLFLRLIRYGLLRDELRYNIRANP
jgi:hypothetical protein